MLAPDGAGIGGWIGCLGLAALICFLCFYATGGLQVETMTTAEMLLTLASGAVLALGAMVMPTGTRAYGLTAALLLGGLAILTAVSLVWSVQPQSTWLDAGRMLSDAGVFAASMVLVRLLPRRWDLVLGAITLAAVVVCGYALLTKVFPDHFAPSANSTARLKEPFGYWNALGLTAAMGAIGCMWLGARRTGHALLSALAYPAMGLLLTTLLLAYSRGALVAIAMGLALWFAIVPLRLRGAAVLIVGALGAGAVTAWDFSTHALSAEAVELPERISAGHELGALILAMLVLLALAGVAVGFASGRHAPSPAFRERAGLGLFVLLGLVVLAFAGALAHSHRGFTGSISHAFNSLTDTHASVPNTPGRLTATASVRAQYWDEALKVWKAHPVLGVGGEGFEVARLRYRRGTLTVKHAHGFAVQTLADLGLIGALLSLALFVAWMAAAGRATHPFNRRWRSWAEVRRTRSPSWERVHEPYPPERIGLLSMLCLVVVFGAHSFIDWTWYVPGDACVALICAGWLAGRGPLLAGGERAAASSRQWRLAPRRAPVGRLRVALAAAGVIAALLAAWAQWQPKRANELSNRALDELTSNPPGALADAQSAVSHDPVSADALFTLAEVQSTGGHALEASATLQKAVRLQPSNPETWLALARFDLAQYPAAAVREYEASIYLDPQSISAEALAANDPKAIEVHNGYLQALRASTAAAARSANASRSRAAGRASRAAHRRRARKRARSRTPGAGP
jgi:hypothetical protein